MPIRTRAASSRTSRAADPDPSQGLRRPVVFYAIGGGLGHLVRSLAVARRLARDFCLRCVVITNSRFHGVAEGEGVEAVFVSSDEVAPAETAAGVLAALDRLSPACVVMDTFPFGITDEVAGWLASCRVPRVFVARPRKDLPVAEAASLSPRFDRVLVPMEEGEVGTVGRERVVATGPILIRGKGEVLGRSEAREELGLGKGYGVLVAHQGYACEVAPIFRLVRKVERRLGREGWAFRYATLHRGPWGVDRRVVIQPFPLMAWMGAFDVVVGGAGYNLFHEVRALGLPALFLPRPRRFDDQAARARGWGEVPETPEDFERALGRLMDSVEAGSKRVGGAESDGAGRAAREIASLL